MFRAARLLRGVSPFSVFLMDQKNNPSLQGVSIAKRGKMLSKMYKELSQQQRRDLQKRAEVHPSLRKSKRARPPRKTEFAEFVRQNYKVVQGLNYRKRFSALSQLYELHKPIEVQVTKALKEAKAKKVTSAKTAVKKAATKSKTAKRAKGGKSTPKKSTGKK
ncbi:putative kinetoplast DNA-associated protein [Leishmania major strain Friedlin]|uniref:Putative kinetoplast DNA-associated protein n=1 Tax=Leishmania major TaxID=5664 RepID=Q4Q0G8_LEIMA|nr:putative kinetoplast DNA-associated protein [Leishmania major strain Friedlin]CAG9584147.1 kinetoplast_DNA-associated_protein_-_putative [Leishmania major strain Friedlin]CAJ09567.1 putative kinetoplast DNA-associated protein [Leishmania major strain Friedlin]|eukprot:XP_001687180.1 putative kinetoplast DNA-associated protein [Leishmania major strain Friedlin]